ncbi:MAG: hypothetical protein K0R08_961 [Solimicrobium sp.]|jgi:hypothetical protein|nr:hypothetical protein [Solimicrobium sp.]
MRNRLLLTATFLLSLLFGCTTADFYAMFQDNARDNCNKMVEPDRSACLTRIPGDYDTYSRQREQARGVSPSSY